MPADPLTAARRAWNEDRWADTVRHAVRSAFWLAFASIDRLDLQSLAGGWLSRARRLLADCADDCVEQGLLLWAQAYHDVVRGAFEAAGAAFGRAGQLGVRFRDPDLLVRCPRGRRPFCGHA